MWSGNQFGDAGATPICDAACHGAELRFAFDYFTYRNAAGKVVPVGATAAEKALSATVQKYWVNFIHSGNPNTPADDVPAEAAEGLVDWPEYSAAEDTVLVLNTTAVAEKVAEGELCDEVWNQIGYLRRHQIFS